VGLLWLVQNFFSSYNYYKMQWIYQTSEISPGSSAILGNNYIAFYAVHFLAIFIIAVSIASSLVVIINVVTIARRKGKHDFSVRFPIYIAIADALWGTSHLCDHVYLLITQTCPQTNTLVIFTIFMVVWLGYFFTSTYKRMIN